MENPNIPTQETLDEFAVAVMADDVAPEQAPALAETTALINRAIQTEPLEEVETAPGIITPLTGPQVVETGRGTKIRNARRGPRTAEEIRAQRIDDIEERLVAVERTAQFLRAAHNKRAMATTRPSSPVESSPQSEPPGAQQ